MLFFVPDLEKLLYDTYYTFELPDYARVQKRIIPTNGKSTTIWVAKFVLLTISFSFFFFLSVSVIFFFLPPLHLTLRLVVKFARNITLGSISQRGINFLVAFNLLVHHFVYSITTTNHPDEMSKISRYDSDAYGPRFHLHNCHLINRVKMMRRFVN